MSEDDLAMVRRAGPPRLWLIMGLVLLPIGVGLIALAWSQLTDPWPGNDAGGWLGLIGGLLQVGVGAVHLTFWRRHRVAYREFRRICCNKCGYDRRGLAADAKCPECGATPAIPAK